MIEAAIFSSLGVSIMCRSLVVRKESNNRRFRMFFGTSPHICCGIWCLIDPYTMMPNGVKPANLLWGIDVTEAVLCKECTCHSGWCQAEECGREDISKVELAFCGENKSFEIQSDTLWESFSWQHGKHMSHFCGWNRFPHFQHSTLLEGLVLSHVQGTRHSIQSGSQHHDGRHCLD